jgi:hypothetical protein
LSRLSPELYGFIECFDTVERRYDKKTGARVAL